MEFTSQEYKRSLGKVITTADGHCFDKIGPGGPFLTNIHGIE